MLILLIYIFLAFVLFHSLSNFLILLELFNDFLIHIWIIPIPPISLSIPIQIYIFRHIIRCNVFHVVLCCYFSRSLCTLLSIMPHGPTILAGSFPESTGLVPLHTSFIPLLNLCFWVLWFCCNVIRFSLFLSIPWNLLYKLRSIFMLSHLSIINILL